jgi:peptidoglycan hydrolase-like protein with peptidoglycan-binding domain
MNCSDSTIDGLLAGDASVKPLYPGAGAPAVGYLQDLLRGHGYSYLPDPRAASYSAYGPATSRAIADYRRRNGLAAEDQADSGLLRDLVIRPAPKATLGPAYVPLVLDVAFTPILRFVWLTSLFETGGVFQTLNLNSDQCGVSFGILQWSQKPGQLHRFLQACSAREPAEWTRIMGSDSILDYTAKQNGGLDPGGTAVNPAFELTKDPWKSKLQALGASLPIQRVQLDLAAETYRAELAREAGYASKTTSERGFAFLLDLANQFGGGRVERQYKLAAQPGVGEGQVLKAMEDAFTGIARLQFQPQVRARREFFRTTALLSDVRP